MTAPKSQNSMGAAFRWVNQVTSIGFELVVPIFGGFWLDQRYGWSPWLTVGGVLLGSYLSFQGLLRLIRDLDK